MTEEAKEADGFEWCIVEIFGHRKHAGRGREEERFGAKMLRIDVPKVISFERKSDGPAERLDPPRIEWTTHFYGGSSIFSFTLTDEETVMRVNQPSDYARYRLPAPAAEDDDVPFDQDALDHDGGDDE
ncbi:hypothetical protein [Bradyrhizobium sp. SRS-191]|uniref:hypothetical protein n=1 Tax=Bradyrhizobium sp. SRS-191 TaxID=2962606 RepID=UPI00211E1624|nr:hypothetical protein [Bradyrhizobium sp. SRS-191]